MTEQPQINAPDAHARAIMCEMDWLEQVITARLNHFFTTPTAPWEIPAPPALPNGSALEYRINNARLTLEARLVLALAMAPQVHPAVLDPFYVKNSAIDRVFSEFGSARPDAASFQPSGVTAFFLLGGIDTAARINAMRLLASEHPLRSRFGLTIGRASESATAGQTAPFAGPLELPPHKVAELCTGVQPKPDFSPQFPARRLETKLNWDELILPAEIKHNLGQICTWLDHRRTILDGWQLASRLGEGFRVLFYGPPGTGKTLSASLLGKQTGMDVYRIDLAMIVSKYIGETEKNLSHVFDMAAEQDMILFFDEADALFGARTSVGSSNDRYANQEVSYLLQRIEDCPNLVILATNLRSNIDDAFFRRFQMAVGFTKPDLILRRALWRNILRTVPLAADVDIEQLAQSHKLTGAAINNVVRQAAISTVRRGAKEVSTQDLLQAVSSELRKEGRTL